MVAIELGIDEHLDITSIAPLDDPPELLTLNPSSKVPVLTTSSGQIIYDSRVIVSYLNSLVPGSSFYPLGESVEAWAALTLSAQCEAIVDAAVSLRLEQLRPTGEQSSSWSARWVMQIRRNLAVLPQRLNELGGYQEFAQLGAVVMLSYLDFRHPTLKWRAGSPELARMLEDWQSRRSFVETAFPA